MNSKKRVLLTWLLLSPLFLGGACKGLARPAKGGAPVQEPEPEAAKDSKYGELITEEAHTEAGLFLVHQVDEKLLFEIPNELLDRDLLLVSRIARVPAGLSGGFIAAGHKTGEQVLRFERVGERLLLRKVSYRNVADEEEPILLSVTNNNFFPILAAFDIAAEGPAEAGEDDPKTSVVVDVTEFFEGDIPAISGLSASLRKTHEVKGLDKDRSFVNYARAFPENVDVRHTLTFRASDPPTDAGAETLSLEMHQSMILLPAEPMRPRFADQRVGWFTLRRTNYGLEQQKAADEQFLVRWRLEPSDPEAYARGELVEPKKPIVYYLDPATPPRWRPWVRQGVEDWQAAFESAGFKNAILAKDAPTPEEDPDWSAEDVRHSMVRWAATTFRNAMGPSVSDPRTGEILESEIVWFHNHLRSYRNRLLIETGAANPLARSLPVDDALLGEALRQVIAHEVGHALGLPHNMQASSSYPVESLRDPDFARRMGVSASIMDYARQNYVAQPGDGLEGADFIRQIGPYDHYAIEWGYRVLPGVTDPAAEKPVLDGWILGKAGDPLYRFGARASGLPLDPRTQTEDLGDDPILASTYGLANLRRVVPRLLEWTSKPGEDYGDLEELHGELISTYARYISHVVAVVGGVFADRKASDQEGAVYERVPAGEQRRAMAFLTEHALTTPRWLLDSEILRRIQHGGDVERLHSLQARILDQLLDPGRMRRLVEGEVEQGDQAYALAEFLEDVRQGVWSRIDDPYARSLQRAHIERLQWLLGKTASSASSTPVVVATSDLRALARLELKELEADARLAADAEADRTLRAHWLDVAERIAEFFDGSDRG